MARILITGGAGFIGQHLVNMLSEQHEIIIIDRKPPLAHQTAHPHIEYHQGDVCCPKNLDHILKDKADMDYVYHLAAISSVQSCFEQLFESTRINILGWTNLIQTFSTHQYKPKMLLASSAAIYGNTKPPLIEHMPGAPLSSYGADKLHCEHHATTLSQQYQIPMVCARLFNVYGPHQVNSAYAGVITRFIHDLDNNTPITIYGNGSQCRDFIYVGDVCQMLISLIEHATWPAPVFNLATGQTHTLQQLANTLMSLFEKQRLDNCPPPPQYKAKRAGDIHLSFADIGKIQSIGIQANTPLEEGLKHTIRSLLTKF